MISVPAGCGDTESVVNASVAQGRLEVAVAAGVELDGMGVEGGVELAGSGVAAVAGIDVPVGGGAVAEAGAWVAVAGTPVVAVAGGAVDVD